AGEGVGAHQAGQHIGTGAAGDHVGKGVARAGEVAHASKREVLDVVAQDVAGRHRVNFVRTTSCHLHYRVGRLMNHVHVVAGAASEHVGHARRADQQVIAAAADDVFD